MNRIDKRLVAKEMLRVVLLVGALVVGGCILLLELAHADPLTFRNDQYIPPVVVQTQIPKMVEIECNCGPNQQTSGSPTNPVVKSIHPK
jgi:hypothetical protein